MMSVIKRLPELITDPRGKLSSTRFATLVALAVSSTVVVMCGYWNRQPIDALAVYLGAWVTHAGVQAWHGRNSSGADTPPSSVKGSGNEHAD